MTRVAFFLCLLAASSLGACVDGKTPDCTSVDSGCFPGDTGSPVVDSGSDVSSDASPSDASDASTDVVVDAPVD